MASVKNLRTSQGDWPTSPQGSGSRWLPFRGLHFPEVIVVPRRVVITILGSFYFLAFVLSPYWTLLRSPVAIVLSLSIVLGLGAVWACLSSANVELVGKVEDWSLLAMCLILVTLLNSRTLTSVIPWRGDESTLITRTRDLISRVPLSSFALLSLAGVLLLAAVAARRWWAAAGSTLLALYSIGRVFEFGRLDDIGASVLIRWPYVNYWIFALVPLLAKYFWDANHEFLYRVIPLLSAVGMVWLTQRRLAGHGIGGKLLWGGAIATIPVLFYYSSILYVDVLVAFLVTAVCMRAKEMLTEDFDAARHRSAWLALVLLGFLKDTAIVFVAPFLLFRMAVSLQKLTKGAGTDHRAGLKELLSSEAALVFCTLYPYLANMGLRAYLATVRAYTRSYSPSLQRVLEPAFYEITARSFFEQFGVFLPLFLAGVAILCKRKERLTTAFAAAVFVCVPLFYGLDAGSVGLTGYSRFNLYVLPAILLGSVATVQAIAGWRRPVSIALACLAIIANLILSPIHMDGTKIPNWGTYELDTAEHYYPYDEAMLWLKNKRPADGILFSEMYYDYYLSFYFAKFQWHPRYEVATYPKGEEEESALPGVLSQARRGNFDLILYQVGISYVPTRVALGEYCIEKIFQNQAQRLLLLSRKGKCDAGP